MITIKNVDSITTLREEDGENGHKQYVETKTDILIKANSSLAFDTGINIKCTTKDEVVFVEGNGLSETGICIEDIYLTKENSNKNLILNIENVSNEDLLIEADYTLVILYTFVKYGIKPNIQAVFEQDGIVVGYDSKQSKDLIGNVELQIFPDGKKKLSFDLLEENDEL